MSSLLPAAAAAAAMSGSDEHKKMPEQWQVVVQAFGMFFSLFPNSINI
jgi:hypothetical protein